jgi:hypothetical protein
MAMKPLTRCPGLYTNPNDIGEIPEGALVQADNVVISRDGIVEARRGSEIKSVKQLVALFGFKGRLLGSTGTALSLAASDFSSWSDYAGAVPAAGNRLRTAMANGNLYVASAQGIQRLESPTGTLMPAGSPPGLDLQTSVSGAGNAVPNNTQVAYRSIFGYRDGNGNFIVGVPSSRSVLVNTAGSTQNVAVNASLPRNLTAKHVWQLYRTWSSVDQNTDPGDEPGLIYEGPVPIQQAVTQLARATNVVTATTAQAHGYASGMIVRVSPGGGTVGYDVAIESNTTVQRSTNNGASYSSAGISGLPAGTFYGASSNGATTVVVGASVCATSTDGLTFTPRTIPAGTYRAVVYGNSVWVAIGDNNAVAYSTDGGATWNAGSFVASGTWDLTAIVYTGSGFRIVGNAHTGGAIWEFFGTSNGAVVGGTGISAGGTAVFASGLTYTGSQYVVVGSSNGVACVWYTPDVYSVPVSAVSLGDSGQASAVCYSGTACVAVGNTGKAYYSTAGTYWNSTALPGTWTDIIWDSVNVVAVGASVAATATADGLTWTSRTITAGTYNAVVGGGGASFLAGEKTITGTPSGTTFTYAETGTDGTLVQAQTATPLTAAYTDNVPNTFIGAALYTNPSQLGIQGSNSLPPVAADLALFRGCLFFGQVTPFATVNLALLAVGSPSGVQNGDTVTIDGVVWTGAASESPSGRTFQVFTGGTVAQNIANTAQSLVRVINRTQTSDVYAAYASGPTDPPGYIILTAIAPTTTISVAFSGHTSSWSPAAGVTVAPTDDVNRLCYSPVQQPDAVPLLNYMRIGATDQPILRIVTLRDSLVVLKTDGIWRITGYSPADFRVDPLDVTVNLLAADTAVALENTVVALTQQGVVRISDTGVTVISRPIENLILPLLGPGMLATTSTVAFGVAYESGRKYLLWLPTLATDLLATQAFVYDLFTDTWTHDTRPLTHAIVNPADDRLYLADGTNLRQERKSFNATDYADESYPVTISASSGASVTISDATNALVGDRLVQGALTPGAGAVITAKNGNVLILDRSIGWSNGAAAVYRAFPEIVEWECQTPRETGPGTLAHWREADYFFRSVFFAQASATFHTELVPTTATEPLTGSRYPLTDPPAEHLSATIVRAVVPRQHQRSARLSVSWAMTQAMCQMQLQGMQPVYEAGRERTGR